MADVIIIEQESEGDSWKREEGWEQDLRRQLARAFPGWPVVILPPGVMMSVEPAIASLMGFVVLGQALDAVELGGIACVIAASAGALAEPEAPPPLDT